MSWSVDSPEAGPLSDRAHDPFANTALGVTALQTGTITTSMIRGPSGTLTGMTRNGATYHHLTDAQGSVTTVVDNAGQQADAYTPHGTARTTTETVPQHWRYTGAYLDPTGLYKMGARYHDPALARFTQPDPSGRETNTYAYTGGDPVNYTDLNGTSLLGLVSAALDWKSVIDVAGAASEDDSSGASASTAGTLAGAIPESTRGTAALAAGTPTGGIAAVGVGALCLGSGEFDGSQVEGALS